MNTTTYILKSLQTGRAWSDSDGTPVHFPTYTAAMEARDSVPSGILYGYPVAVR